MKFKNIEFDPTRNLSGILALIFLFLVHWTLGVGYLVLSIASSWIGHCYWTTVAPTNHLLYTAWYVSAEEKGWFYPALRIGEYRPKIVMTFKDHIAYHDYEAAIEAARSTARYMNELEESQKNKPPRS